MSGSFSKATSPNPKDLIGAKKVSLSKFPAIGLAHGAHAMMDGANKYGPYNWREKAVQASIYIDAAKRHLDAWFEGEETASDSGVHHLGHAMACMAIILDAQANDGLIDDRPKNVGAHSLLMEELNSKVKAKSEKTPPVHPQNEQPELLPPVVELGNSSKAVSRLRPRYEPLGTRIELDPCR